MAGVKEEALPSPSLRICVLKYSDAEPRIDSTEGVVILLAVKDEVGLKLYVHPSIRQLISERHEKYIGDLLEDLIHRAKGSPGDVFRHLSSLSVGPIYANSILQAGSLGREVRDLFPDFFPPAE